MRMNLRFALLFPFLLTVLLTSTVFPLTARADDATATVPADPATSTAQPTNAATTPTPTATQASPATDLQPTESVLIATGTPSALAADGGVAQATATPSSSQEASAIAATATSVVVLDSAGQQVPLSSTTATEIMAAGDPIWCPTGYLPGDTQCTSAAPSITSLIALLGSMSGAGTIYFVSSGYSLPDATLNHSDPSLVNLTDLTVQGGWNGLSGPHFGLAGTTTFTVPLTINWVGNVTLNDLIFNSSGGDSLGVTTAGNITLDNVEAKGNHAGRGARLDNTAGGAAVAVNVSNSNFHDNQTGLVINSLGDVSLAAVLANYNDAAGAVASGKKVTVDGGEFTWNGTSGLVVAASDNAYLVDVQAARNNGTGAVVSGNNVGVDTANFDHNAGQGLVLASAALVTLNDVSTSWNNSSGLVVSALQNVSLNTVISTNNVQGAVIWTAGNVVIANGAFDENTLNGASVQSVSGDITVDCTSMTDNGNYGLVADLPGALELKGDNFSGNGAGGYSATGGGSLVLRPNFRCNVTRTPTPSVPALPMNIVPVRDGQIVTLNCTRFIGTTLVLPNRDQVVFPCPILGDASLSSVGQDQLPGPLDTGLTYVSGMKATLAPTLNGTILVDFVLPQGQENAKFSILRWDDTEWVDLRSIPTVDGFLEAHSTRDGVFVLVSK